MVQEALLRLGFQTTLIKSYFDSSPRLSDLVDCLETTDRPTVRAIIVVRRIDPAIVAEEQAVRAVTVRRSRPIGAVVADIAETAIIAVAMTRSRVPNYGCTAELSGEVHAFVSAIVWIVFNVIT